MAVLTLLLDEVRSEPFGAAAGRAVVDDMQNPHAFLRSHRIGP
jgi:hypothetical protein